LSGIAERDFVSVSDYCIVTESVRQCSVILRIQVFGDFTLHWLVIVTEVWKDTVGCRVLQ